jgi:hypothetical protein
LFFEVANAINTGDWSGVEQEIKNFDKALSNINFEAGTEDIINFAVNTLDTIITEFNKASENITAEDFQTAADFFLDAYVTAIERGVKEIDWSEFIGNVVNMIGKAIVGSGRAFYNNFRIPFQIMLYKALNNALDGAEEWGENLIQEIKKGIQNEASELRKAVESIELTAGVTVGDVASDASIIAGAAEGEKNDFIGSVQRDANQVFLDGSRVDDNQGRYRKDNLNRRS